MTKPLHFVKTNFIIGTVCFLTARLLSAETPSYLIDLDGDGKQEKIYIHQSVENNEQPQEASKETIVDIYTYEREAIGSFLMPYEIDKLLFVSLNKDNSKQIAAWSSVGKHYVHFAIYEYQGNRFQKLFRNASLCSIDVDFAIENPIIKIGRADWQKVGWRLGRDEPIWEVYVWDGEKFFYDETCSTSPQVSEQEEKQKCIERAKDLSEKLDKKINALLEKLDEQNTGGGE